MMINKETNLKRFMFYFAKKNIISELKKRQNPTS